MFMDSLSAPQRLLLLIEELLRLVEAQACEAMRPRLRLFGIQLWPFRLPNPAALIARELRGIAAAFARAIEGLSTPGLPAAPDPPPTLRPDKPAPAGALPRAQTRIARSRGPITEDAETPLAEAPLAETAGAAPRALPVRDQAPSAMNHNPRPAFSHLSRGHCLPHVIKTNKNGHPPTACLHDHFVSVS